MLLPCHYCFLRRYAERNPHSLLARLWRWHTRFCPGWKAYQRQLATHSTPPPEQHQPKL